MSRLLFVFVLFATPLAGQVRAPKKPANPPPAPRLKDGTPNLGPVEPNKGYWAPQQYQDYTAIAEPKEIPYQQWARELANYRKVETASKVRPPGILPAARRTSNDDDSLSDGDHPPEQKRILMIYEGGAHVWRLIYMDGRSHPEGDALNPTWMGHSVGRWDGDTLVIDTVGFNEGTWIDMGGKPHTDQLHLIERLTRTDLYTLHCEATIDDPAAYNAPWKVRFDVTWDPNGQIQEYICQENNLWKDRVSGNSRIHLDSR